MLHRKSIIKTAIAGSILMGISAAATAELRIEAGADQTTTLGAGALLNGSVSKEASIGWSLAEGPGQVSFESQRSATTRVTFSAPGEYTLMLGGYDGYVAYDFVKVSVRP